MAKAADSSRLVGQLAAGVSRLTSSEEWHRHLELQGRFHRYSYANVVLIAAQCPHATRVAGFHAWRRLGRFVRRGEKAIWILAPVVRPPTTKLDAEEGDGAEEPAVRGFRPVPVFDVSQTDGQALASVCRKLDGADPDGHFGALAAVACSIGYRVEDHRFAGSASGDCSPAERLIRVSSDASGAQRVKTLVHELAHALLHETFESRALAELEAESVAYVVCQVLGVDSGAYSFGYVASWAGGGDEAVRAIKASCQRIQQAAQAILSARERLCPAGEGTGV